MSIYTLHGDSNRPPGCFPRELDDNETPATYTNPD